MSINSVQLRVIASSVVALSIVGQGVAAPLTMLQAPSSDTEAASSQTTGEVVQETQVSTPRFSMPKMPKLPKISPPKNMFTKWFGGKHQSPVSQFNNAKKDPKEVYSYQAPQKPHLVAMNTKLSSTLKNEQTPASQVATEPYATELVEPAIESPKPGKKVCTEGQTRAVVEMAQGYEASGELEQARQTLIYHLTEYSFDIRALRALGHLEDRAGELTQAEVHYRQAIGVDPKNPSVMNDLGLCLARQGRLAEANEALHDAIEQQPAKALYRNNIATILVELGQSDAALSQLQAVYPPATASYNLGQILIRSGQTDAAIENFKQAISIDPGHSAALNAMKKYAAKTENESIPAVASTGIEDALSANTTPQQSNVTPIAQEASKTEEVVEELKASEDEVVSVAGAPDFPRLLPPVINH